MHPSKPLAQTAVEGSRTGHGSSLRGMSLVYGPLFTPVGKDNIFVVLEYIKVIGTLYVIFIYLFIYLFWAALGLHFCARALSSCGKRGPLFIAVHRPLTIAASLVAEHRLQTCRLSSCGSRA